MNEPPAGPKPVITGQIKGRTQYARGCSGTRAFLKMGRSGNRPGAQTRPPGRRFRSGQPGLRVPFPHRGLNFPRESPPLPATTCRRGCGGPTPKPPARAPAQRRRAPSAARPPTRRRARALPTTPPGAPARVTGRAPTHAPPARARALARPVALARPPPRPPPARSRAPRGARPPRPWVHAPPPPRPPLTSSVPGPPRRTPPVSSLADGGSGGSGDSDPGVRGTGAQAGSDLPCRFRPRCSPSPSHPPAGLHPVLAALGRRARRPPSRRPPQLYGAERAPLGATSGRV